MNAGMSTQLIPTSDSVHEVLVILTPEIPQTVAQRLGHFVNDLQWQDLSDTLQHDAKRSLVNFFGGALGVAHHPEFDALVSVLDTFSGPRQATIIGRSERMDILSAAMLNAVSSNLLDYDDTHLNTVMHPTAPVAPPVLALAEQHRYSGQEVLLAFILGAEIECRIGNAVSPHHYARGWHITATCGIFGATVAAAKLRRLSPEQIAHAIGIAASQSSGLVENLPYGAKNIGVGHAARNGIFAALMAERGYTGAPTALEGSLGWARASGDEFNTEQLLTALGEVWEVSKNTFKPYPCGIVMHAVIDACFELQEAWNLNAAQIAAVHVKGNALLLARGDRAVHNERDARVSIHHCVAAPFLWNKAGVEEFSQAHVMSDNAIEFRSRVHPELDDNLPVGAATVEVHTQSGDTVTATVTQARGSLEKPLSDTELEAKVHDLAADRLSLTDIQQLCSMLWQVQSMDTIEPLMHLVSVPD